MKSYFTQKELECPCCGFYNIKEDFLLKLNKAREIAEIPFVINSGVRCKKHNKEMGGLESSSHLIGRAADIRIPSGSWHRYKIVTALLGVGFERLGIYKNFVHVDNDPSKPKEMIWYGD